MKKATAIVSLLALALVGGACAAQHAQQGAAGCPMHDTPKAQAPAAPASAGVPQGTVVKCPVTGEDVTVTPDALHSVYAGKDYYFCCAPCKASFDQDPQKYLQGK